MLNFIQNNPVVTVFLGFCVCVTLVLIIAMILAMIDKIFKYKYVNCNQRGQNETVNRTIDVNIN